MEEKKAVTATAAKFEIPGSLRRTLEKLPSAEALQIVDDIGKTAWVIDNNNNNNNSKKGLGDDVIQTLSKMPSDQLAKLLIER